MRSAGNPRAAGSIPASGYSGLSLGKTLYFSLPRTSDGTYSHSSSRLRDQVACVYCKNY